MNGLMMDVPLTISAIVRHAERVHGHAEIVSVTRDNPRHRYDYRPVLRVPVSWRMSCRTGGFSRVTVWPP